MSLFWTYRHIFLRYRVHFILGALALIGTNLIAVRIPWLIKDAVNRIEALLGTGAGESFAESVYPILGSILILSFGMLVARVASRYFLVQAGRRIEFDLRNALYDHMLKMERAFFAKNPTGELMSRMTNDIEILRMLTSGGIMLGLNTLFVYLTTIPAMWMLSPRLTLLVFVAYPFTIVFVTRLSASVRTWYYKVQEALADISTISQENFSGIAAIQAYAIEQNENKRFGVACDNYFGTYRHLIKERVLLMLMFMILGGLSYLIVLAFGGWQVIDASITLGDFIAFTLYLERITWPTTSFGWTISIFQQGSAAMMRINDVLQQQPTIVSPEQPVSPAHTNGHLEIKNLSFTYNDKPVLQDISLDIPPGSTVAVVGGIGSGKSTLLRLLPRLYDAPPGHIFLDSVDITRMSLPDLRNRVVLMPQQSFLFSTTVAHNIAFGKPEIAPDVDTAIAPVAEIASVHEDILKFPKQYKTLVGERGILLSGGQRQRVSFARALMMHLDLDTPTVLVLDDPFSHVDAEIEEGIIETIERRKLFGDKTTIFATHRFSLVRKADLVVLLHEGKIAATGTHAALQAGNPLYQQLTRLDELRAELQPNWQSEAEDANAISHKETAHD